jgi:hypothetical protein
VDAGGGLLPRLPEHEVLNGGLVDDTSNPVVRKVYFDLVTVGNETVADHSDTNK